MLEVIISYLQQALQLVYPDLEVKGLVVKYADTDGEREINFPAEYCSNGQYNQVNPDYYKGLIYFRQISDVRSRRLSAEETSDFSVYEERIYALRIVAFIQKDIYKTDNAFIADKIAENFTKAVTVQSKKVLLDTLSDADDINISVSSRITNDLALWQEEYTGVEYNVPSTMQALAVDIDVAIIASLECFEHWGCLDEPLQLTITNPVTLLYEDGTEFQVFQQTPFTIHDNRIYNSDGTLNTTIKPEQPFTLPPDEECLPVTIFNSDNSYTTEVETGGTIVLADTIVKDSTGATVITEPYSEEIILADSVAKNSLNETVGTAPYGTDIIVGDSNILKVGGTSIYSLPAENNVTTAALIALMSALELYNDLTSAEKINAVIALLTNTNLQQLTPTQLDYITTILTNSNLANLTTVQRNYVVTILQAAQVQLLSNTQLAMLSTAQVAYIAANNAPTTYAYPIRTFATTIYQTGDAKWVRDNYFPAVLPFGITPRLADAKNLATYNNVFGNLKRFTGLTGGYQHDTITTTYYDVNGNVTTEALAFPGDYVIDHLTGLARIRTAFATGSWSNAVSTSNTYSITINGTVYNNWFLEDEKMLDSIRTHGSSIGLDAPFTVTSSTWTSSTAPALTTSALAFAVNGGINVVSKGANAFHFKCRKHF